jgi:hypothetical protein
MEDNVIWLIYLYGIYPNINGLIITLLVIVGFAIFIYFFSIFVMWINDNKNYINYKFTWKNTKYLYIYLLTVLMFNLIPSRNTLLLMLSAKPIVKTSKAIIDSNTTKSIESILNNSLKYLETKTKELNKGK